MLTKEAGQTAAGDLLLRQALAIYEKALGADSAQAKFVRDNLTPGHVKWPLLSRPTTPAKKDACVRSSTLIAFMCCFCKYDSAKVRLKGFL